MIRYYLGIFFFLSLTGLAADDLHQRIERIYAHLTIQDPFMARLEAEAALDRYPQSKNLWKAYLKTLSVQHDEKQLLAIWQEYIKKFPEENNNHEVIEWIAWSMIEKLSLSSSPLIRCMSLLAAFYAQDAQGVQIIYQALFDPNAVVRGIAVELTPQLGDDKLKQALRVLFKQERNWQVRLEVIRALGKMKVDEARDDLLNILAGNIHSDEEKLSAIEALVCLYENPSKEEIAFLARSTRAGMRQLACEVISEYQLKDYGDLIDPLLEDHHSDVRAAAVEACGFLKRKQAAERLKDKLKDPDYRVAIKSAWALTLIEGNHQLKNLEPWFFHESGKVKLLASAALNQCGQHGYPLNIKMFQAAKDPFVKMNLAIGLIGQRIEVAKAGQAIYEGLITNEEKWMWKEEGAFKMLAPSDASYSSQIPQYPQVLNQMTRLEILNILAIVKHPGTENAIKQFLAQKHWGISAIASSLLLTEGDDSILAVMEELLEKTEFSTKVQIALVLAQWGREEKALQVLEEAYARADTEKKEKILEGLIQIASPESIPFFIKCLYEPYATLKTIASLGLIRCIYH